MGFPREWELDREGRSTNAQRTIKMASEGCEVDRSGILIETRTYGERD